MFHVFFNQMVCCLVKTVFISFLRICIALQTQESKTIFQGLQCCHKWLSIDSSLVNRLLGLTGVVRTDCAEVYGVNFHSEANWQMFINPAVLLLLYWILAFETCAWYRKKVRHFCLLCMCVVWEREGKLRMKMCHAHGWSMRHVHKWKNSLVANTKKLQGKGELC